MLRGWGDTAGEGLSVEERLLQSVKLQDDNSGKKATVATMAVFRSKETK